MGEIKSCPLTPGHLKFNITTQLVETEPVRGRWFAIDHHFGEGQNAVAEVELKIILWVTRFGELFTFGCF
jgi:hypothetical protein